VRGSLALDRAVRSWALLHGREYVIPEDVERLFIPVLAHRIVFAPRFLIEMRRIGREESLERFAELCLERAPRPAVRDDGAVVPLEASS
jgi:MoxR-like ATPase